MLLPDTQVMIAQQQIDERMRRSEQWQREQSVLHGREARDAHEQTERSWLRQLFFGKNEA